MTHQILILHFMMLTENAQILLATSRIGMLNLQGNEDGVGLIKERCPTDRRPWLEQAPTGGEARAIFNIALGPPHCQL